MSFMTSVCAPSHTERSDKFAILWKQIEYFTKERV